MRASSSVSACRAMMLIMMSRRAKTRRRSCALTSIGMLERTLVLSMGVNVRIERIRSIGVMSPTVVVDEVVDLSCDATALVALMIACRSSSDAAAAMCASFTTRGATPICGHII